MYAALTEQAGLASWWTPDVTAQPRVGSVAEFRFRGGQYVTRMQITALGPGATWSGPSCRARQSGPEPPSAGI
ncbi:MAG: hypothetical protein JO020_33000 [Chloroflexi bacterium]|nr:hypothetical protein [Chloroflexota bacterium]